MAWSGVVQSLHDDLKVLSELLQPPAYRFASEDVAGTGTGVLPDCVAGVGRFRQTSQGGGGTSCQQHRLFVPPAVEQAYARLLQKLDERNRARLGEGEPAAGCGSPTIVLRSVGGIEAACSQDDGRGGWYEQDVASFESPELFACVEEDLDSWQYRKMLEHKVHAVIYAVIHRLGNRFRTHSSPSSNGCGSWAMRKAAQDDVDRQVYPEC